MDEMSSVMSAESEHWEAAIDNIPDGMRVLYAPFVANLVLATRINLYKILDSLDWTFEFCEIVLDVMRHVSVYLESFVNYGIQLDVSRRPLFFHVCRTLEEPQLCQFLSEIPYAVVENYMELSFYLSKHELSLMFEFITKLSVQELNAIIHRVDEPMAKHCRLCKSKRLYALETRLHNGQIDDIHATMPGTLALYEKADVWRADNEEKFFTFNYDAGVILWRNQIVDLVKICDDCLNEAHRASSEVARFEPIHHEEGYNKKELVTILRQEEKRRAVLINQLAIEQVRRRAREWAMRTLKTHREALILEEKEEADQQARAEADRRQMEEEELRHEVMHKAMSVDGSWVEHEAQTQHLRNQTKFDMAELKWLPRYDMSNPAKPDREHPHSWKHLAYGGSSGNLPIEPQAVIQRFGTGKVTPDIRTAELIQWKRQAADMHQQHLQRLAVQEDEAADARRKETIDLNQFVQDKFYNYGRQEKQRQREAEQAEEDRLIARSEARAARRASRIAGEEARERALMEVEDKHSWQHRYFLHECSEIARELADMSQEETAQTVIDRFWGIPTAIRDAKNVKMSENQEWHAQVDDLRRMSMEVKILRPYKSEIGKYRDRYSGKPIR